MVKTALKRFARGFAAGAVAVALTLLTTGTPPKDFKELATLAFPVLVGGLTGALLALDKVVRWQDPI